MARPCTIFLLLLLTACGSADHRAQRLSAPRSTADFSGHWELDYGRSDNIDNKLRTLYREWQRLMERQQSDRRSRASPLSDVENSYRNFNGIVASARLADLITSSQVLDIEQTDTDVVVKRENSFALSCVFSSEQPPVVVDELGSEFCRLNADQLFFLIRLPDRLTIHHRLSLSADATRLQVVTTVDSAAARPFTVNRFYFRFEPLPQNYRCGYTLSKGYVCQTGSS